MDSPSPQTPDLSLFCGDLLPTCLITVGSSEVYNEDIKTLALDGVTESWTDPSSHLLDIHQLSSLNHDSGLGEELFEASWLDTRVDLLDLLEDPDEIQPVISLSGPELFNQKVDSSSVALMVLQDVADATSQILATEEPPINQATTEPVIFTPDVTTDLGLEDLLTTDFPVNPPELHTELDFDLFGEPILSPVSAEDVESLLASEPTSPVREETAASLLCQMEVASAPEVSTVEESIISSDDSFTVILSQPVASPASDDEWLPTPIRNNHRSSRRSAPYEKPHKPQDRKQRKKQQNKDAATRYRQKKKAEQSAITGECDALVERNTKLHEKVDQMTQEIQYLKDLMADVTRAQRMQIKLKAK